MWAREQCVSSKPEYSAIVPKKMRFGARRFGLYSDRGCCIATGSAEMSGEGPLSETFGPGKPSARASVVGEGMRVASDTEERRSAAGVRQEASRPPCQNAEGPRYQTF